MSTIDTTMPGYTTEPERGTSTFNTDMQTRMNEMAANATAINSIASQMNTVATEVNTAASNAADSDSNAADSAAAAAVSAATAADYAGSINAASTSSQTIGTGLKTFTIQSGKQFAPGQFVSVVYNGNTDYYMHGTVNSYSGTQLIVDVSNLNGSGTYADWSISLSGSQGPQGVSGPSGNLTFLYSVVASDASSVVFEDDIDSTYNAYVVDANNITGGGTVTLRVGTGATPTYQATGYRYTRREQAYDSSILTISNQSSTNAIYLFSGTAGGSTAGSLFLKIMRPSSSSGYSTILFQASDPSSSITFRDGCGAWINTTAITALQLSCTSVVNGTFNFYGVR